MVVLGAATGIILCDVTIIVTIGKEKMNNSEDHTKESIVDPEHSPRFTC